MEVRLYAEDPDNNFFPSPGKILSRHAPSGPGIRLDEGVYEGWTVPMDYDPLLSKLIAWGNSREETIARLRRALEEYSDHRHQDQRRPLSPHSGRAGFFGGGDSHQVARRIAADDPQSASARSDSAAETDAAAIAAAVWQATHNGTASRSAGKRRDTRGVALEARRPTPGNWIGSHEIRSALIAGKASRSANLTRVERSLANFAGRQPNSMPTYWKSRRTHFRFC